MKVCDGGYLAWCYGCNPRFQSSFSPATLKPYLVAMDGGELMRTKGYPAYKAHRAERRANSEEKEATYQRVRRFSKTLWVIPDLYLYSYPGLEADDIIGILAWMHGPIELMGVDKDLFQLGTGIGKMYKVGGEPTTIESYFKKMPKALAGVKHTPENLLFLLCMMGDKSDGIERLVPPYQLDGFRSLALSESKWTEAYLQYGDSFLHNLYMVTIPFPGLFGIQPLELMDRVSRGEWKPCDNLWGRMELLHKRLYDDMRFQSDRMNY